MYGNCVKAVACCHTQSGGNVIRLCAPCGLLKMLKLFEIFLTILDTWTQRVHTAADDDVSQYILQLQALVFIQRHSVYTYTDCTVYSVLDYL